MKKALAFFLCLILSFSSAMLFACADGSSSSSSSSSSSGSGTVPPEPQPEPDPAVNVFKDCGFKKGFDLMGLDSAQDGTTVIKKIRYGTALGNAQWKIAQWWCKYNLAQGEELSSVDRYVLKDTHKSVSVDIASGDLTLALDSSYDFSSAVTSAPAKWPHLLIEQSVSSPVFIKDKKYLNAALDFTIDKSEDKRLSGGAMLHSQFAWFIYLVDKNPESAGYGNFLWFGLNIFSSTAEYTSLYSSQDTAGGLGNFIYSLGSADFLSEKIETGKRNQFTVDILPFVKQALATAQERGFMVGTTYNDIAVTGTNIGWEIFDRWDESVTIHNIALNYENK